MKARSRELLDRAIAAMVAAIDIYNKPDFPYRAESFTILALNAWELLLKAKWLAMNRNRLSSLYVRQGGGSKRPRYKRTRSGSLLTHSIDYLTKKLTEQKVLDEACRKNLDALAELRDIAVHFYHRSPELAERVQEIGMAAVKNFAAAAQDWFNEDLSRFNFYLMPLSFVAPPVTEAVELNREEKRFLKYLASLENTDADPNARYSVAVNIEVRFVRSKSLAATPVRVAIDPNAPAVRLTEEQIRERYPWDYRELTEQCRRRYSNFKVDKEYHQLRKSLANNPQFAHIRRLDPQNPKSPKKTFYSQAILREFDKAYKKKS
ncbi:hypothetical protein Spith_1215 [Spirochaeta thermophila DSM 6578]|uniref:DUF3644 domain-containing protein n=1 Tax=Winmispira thermophila (strain ATCC 700085 / DSM 6578 / Z-1203) TaxID=869211 RepID=G0GES7_WINT7|nr:DUF3644 domain-containing protein [Spirochaeta thermophila]AEJ61483.1 hypothetical protein Spith_1215 [Spirochaeta thermophila DSM 6578]